MEIVLNSLSKRYLYDWIYKDINHTFTSNSSTAITGNNGSGKSTLLKAILGIEQASKGSISYFVDNKEITPEQSAKKISFVSPYQSLIEEFTTNEMIEFHFRFAKKNKKFEINNLLIETNLIKDVDKKIMNFSSGMKQRLKLILAFCSNTPLLLLDEPTVNLDEQGIEWYRSIIKKVLNKKTIIISSNQNFEYDFCQNNLDIRSYKN